MDWTEKYRPKTLRDVLGNPTAVSQLESWARSWDRKIPAKRAVILVGVPGVGKTSAALALANDEGWSPVEMNASDRRNAQAVRQIALRGAITQTFTDTGEFLTTREGGRKLIILDEADNLFGREDTGGIGAIVQTIRETHQPIVLIVNDVYELTRRSSSLKSLCRTIQFQNLHVGAIKTALRGIARAESLSVSDDVIDGIADRAAGDLRSAINDLQSLAVGREALTLDSMASLGTRDRESTVFAALREIFQSSDAKRARRGVMNLDEAPSDLLLWIDENLPYEYRLADDLERGFDAVSRSDRYLGRARRRQAYGLWSYATDMMTAGVATARRGRFSGGRYRFPDYLIRMSRSRGVRQVRNSLARKIGRHVHTSRRVVLNEVLPVFKSLFNRDVDFRVESTIRLGLDEREVAYILDEKEDSPKVRRHMETVAKVREVLPGERPRGLFALPDEG